MARGRDSRRAARHHQVLGTRELRERIPEILRGFREEGADAKAVVGGANRRPEVVLLPYERYLEMMDELDDLAIQAVYRERVEGRDELTGRSLVDAARELGFDPDELFAPASEGAARTS